MWLMISLQKDKVNPYPEHSSKLMYIEDIIVALHAWLICTIFMFDILCIKYVKCKKCDHVSIKKQIKISFRGTSCHSHDQMIYL